MRIIDRMSRGELRDEIDSLEMRLDESRRALVRALSDASEANREADAAVAAERERCLALVDACAVGWRPWRKMREMIESGALAPRE